MTPATPQPVRRKEARKPTRPALRYHGGKWLLADWIISHFPPHRVYVEPYGGAASVLLQKERSYGEVYNDLDGEIVNLFRVIRENPRRLMRAVAWTPFSRVDYRGAFETSDDPIEQARRTIIRSFMGFGSTAASGKNTGFRSNSNRSGTTPSHDWMNFPPNIRLIGRRLRGVTIEHKSAMEVMAQQDDENVLHYQDPPYVHASRPSMSGDGAYRHEMTDADHRELAGFNATLKGMIVISGYRSDLYDELYGDWQSVERSSLGDGACKRTECLWFNASAWTRLQESKQCLFANLEGGTS